MTPNTQTNTSQYVSVITDHLSLRCEVKTAHDTGYTNIDQRIGREQVSSYYLACFALFAFASMIIPQFPEIGKQER